MGGEKANMTRGWCSVLPRYYLDIIKKPHYKEAAEGGMSGKEDLKKAEG
jgi:hypothetical protein